METILLNPKKFAKTYPDKETEEIMLKTIAFFENKGLREILDDDHELKWYEDFILFQKDENIFAKLFTPQGYGDENSRWDTTRITDFAEILAFYGLCYWYTFQVSQLGLGPIFMGKNEEVKQKAVQLLKEGAIFAFGLSEKEHGADIYSSSMTLTPRSEGNYSAKGEKYYIGNGNFAAMVSTFGKFDDSGDYVFFVVDSQHENYECIKSVVATQNYVAHYALHDYPIEDKDITDRGSEAWDSSLNTINICKFNLGWASIGICTHAFYEALNHASKRSLFGSFVTDFTHIKQFFTDAYTRLVAMKLFALRATDYLRSANEKDRRYLLYNPMVKMKVTTQGEEVINLLWDVIAAKGFEEDIYFSIAARDIRALPKLEGTVHVNMALVVKFMANYFFNPAEYPDIPKMDTAMNDDFLFNQGPTKGLGKIQFHDYQKVYNSVDIANVNIFKDQIALFKEFLMASMQTIEAQSKDVDFLLNVGELFALVVYGQLILENKPICNISDDLIDQIFDFIIRDFSRFALNIYSKPGATEPQQEICLKMIKRPAEDQERFERIWENYVYSLKDTYDMKV